MLPKVDGLTLCQRLRRDDRTAGIPILMLTALGGTKDKVSGFNSGADDYLTKPFDLEELQARVKALLRRSDRAPVGSGNHNEILSYGPLTLVPERFEAIWFDNPVRLTHLEFELLHCLLQRHGQTVAPSLILKEVWGYEPDDDIETIRVHVRHLRTKLEPDPRKPRFIKTVYGAGYCLELPTGGQLDGLQDVVAMARDERKQQGRIGPAPESASDPLTVVHVQQGHLPGQPRLNERLSRWLRKLSRRLSAAHLPFWRQSLLLPPTDQPQLLLAIEGFAQSLASASASIACSGSVMSR